MIKQKNNIFSIYNNYTKLLVILTPVVTKLKQTSKHHISKMFKLSNNVSDLLSKNLGK